MRPTYCSFEQGKNVWLSTQTAGQSQWRDRTGLSPASSILIKIYFNPMCRTHQSQAPAIWVVSQFESILPSKSATPLSFSANKTLQARKVGDNWVGLCHNGGFMKKSVKIVLAAAVALPIVVVAAIPLFVNANTFRPTIENRLSTALSRKVTLGNLSLSLTKGSLEAKD